MAQRPVDDNSDDEDNGSRDWETDPDHVAETDERWRHKSRLEMITDLPVGAEIVSSDGSVTIRVEQLPAGHIGFAALSGDTLGAWTNNAVDTRTITPPDPNAPLTSAIERILEHTPGFSPTFAIQPSTELSPNPDWFAFPVTTDKDHSARQLSAEDPSGLGALVKVTLNSDLKIYHIYASDVESSTQIIRDTLGIERGSIPEEISRHERAGVRKYGSDRVDRILLSWPIAQEVATAELVRP